MAPAATGKVSFVDNLLGLVSRPALTPPQVGAVPAPTTHPLDPLIAAEISAAGKACRLYGESVGLTHLRFNSISLEEPSKAALLEYEASGRRSPKPPRRAHCIVQLPTEPNSSVAEVLVDLSGPTPAVLNWVKVEGVQPMVTIEDCVEAEEIVKADLGVRALLKDRYGLTDMALVAADPWYYGDRYAEESKYSQGRIIQCFIYVRSGSVHDNHYAHPLDLVVVLDMNTGRVLEALMQDKPPVIPQLSTNYLAPLVQKERGFRSGLKPLNIVQPEGPSFQVHGNEISWQKWNMRVSFNYREGLVLHNVGYEDGGRVRPIIHRASTVEIIVPYGDPRSPFHKKCAFDVVDYGLGFSCSSLELGCDCLGHIHYFDAMLNTNKGEPMLIKKAVCMHEEDHGMLWKHVEYRTGHSEVRRSRRLVLSFVATIANYEYGFAWHFGQDGTIEHEVKLTGCLSTNVLSEGEGPLPTHGTLLAPGLNAQVHQHFFCTRLDMAVDDPHGGRNLTVTEVNCESMPLGPDNPHGVGFTATETAFETELQAIREVDPRRSRVWKIKNEHSRNPITGVPVAWKLMPAASPPVYAHPSNEHPRRGAFATKQLWVTPYSDDEKFPAGDYPLLAGDTNNIANWTSLDRKIKDSDCVVWHSFGVTHVPRLEDWPVMPVERVGFHLKPVNFFDANPGMDIAPLPNKASREHQSSNVACDSCGPQSKL
ncbi:Primary amine oxidase [Coccomyxa sp. Obi]|nr:Primary amine oxidase [Coccomyxa sp. Obi]